MSRHLLHPRLLVLAALLATGAAWMAPAVHAEGSAPPPRKARSGSMEMIRSVLEVVSVDEKSRRLSLKRDDGNTLSLVASPSVRNIGQIHGGDFVVAEYGRAQAVSIKRISGNGAGNEGKTPPAPPAKGKTATARNAKVVHSIVADIIAIDDKKGFATLKGSKDNVIDVVVTDRKALAAVKIGDQVRLDYTDAVAISLKPARSKR